MRTFLKKLLIKLSHNPNILEFSKKIFIRFPSLKYFLIDFAYGSKRIEPSKTIIYKNNFLDAIIEEVELRKKSK